MPNVTQATLNTSSDYYLSVDAGTDLPTSVLDFSTSGSGLDMAHIGTANNPCLVLLVATYPDPYSVPSVTFNGYSMSVSPVAQGGGGQPQRSRFIAVLPITPGMVFTDEKFDVVYPGTATVFACTGELTCFYNVDGTATLSALAGSPVLVHAFNGVNPDSFTLPSALTLGAGDAAVTYCGSYDWAGLTNYPYVTAPSGFSVLSNIPLSSTGLFTSMAYKVATGAESDTITWAVNQAASGVYMALGAIALVSTPSTATVPDVTGEPLATAEANLAAAGFVTGTITGATSGTVPIGDVISQNPTGGTVATVGSAVDLVESVSAVVPDVFNLSQPVAEATIVAAGLAVGSVTPQPDVLIIPGNVDGQSPAAGTIVSAGSVVNITVSSGRAGLFIPNVIGLTAAQANQIISDQGFVLNAVAYAASDTVPAGIIISQNPSAGSPTSYGSFMGYTVSLGAPQPLGAFDFNATVISQYANSPTLLRLISNMAQYVDQSQNFANFYSFVWNVDTAQGFGLDIWGKIVGVSRLLQIPNSDAYVGFQDGSYSGPGVGWDVQPFDASGTFYGGGTSTQSYLLDDPSYRVLILAKALANISSTTVPAFNQLLQNLFGVGTTYVTDPGDMTFVITLNFVPTAVQLAILQNSGVIPRPAGVSFTVAHP